MALAYNALAQYYNLIYSYKDYKKESDQIVKLINKYKRSEGNMLLDVGCGTGNHLNYLKKYFVCDGFDLNKGVIEFAKKSISDVNFSVANMIDFNFNKSYDVITCLFSSFAYVKTIENATKTIQKFALHLKHGGVIIIESWFAPEEFNNGRIGLNTYENDDIKIARTSYSYKKENLSFIDMQFIVAEKGKGINHFEDIHELGLFDHDEIKTLMEKHGFKVEILSSLNGRKLFIGTKFL